MHLIKLDATESTNTFLQEMCQQENVEDFTVVFTSNQSKGRGQMGAEWSSEVGKNLMFSVLVKHVDLELKNQLYLSKVVSLAIHQTLKKVLNVNLSIKWPNDILAGQSKIAGILIDNTVRKVKIKHSIIGIGLNVNQEIFNELPNATSMKIISGSHFNLKKLLIGMIDSLKSNLKLLESKKFESIDTMYFRDLYKMNVPSMFIDASGNHFMGKIHGVSIIGKLQVELADESIKEFALREIKFARP